jgi:hypothetical protein
MQWWLLLLLMRFQLLKGHQACCGRAASLAAAAADCCRAWRRETTALLLLPLVLLQMRRCPCPCQPTPLLPAPLCPLLLHQLLPPPPPPPPPPPRLPTRPGWRQRRPACEHRVMHQGSVGASVRLLFAHKTIMTRGQNPRRRVNQPQASTLEPTPARPVNPNISPPPALEDGQLYSRVVVALGHLGALDLALIPGEVGRCNESVDHGTMCAHARGPRVKHLQTHQSPQQQE